MGIMFIIGGALAVVATLILFVRSRIAPTRSVLASDAARVLAQVAASKADPTFAVFIFSTPERPGSEDALNIQFSMENGRAGFDWVLLSPRNLEDEARFIDFARLRGFSPVLQEANNVRYLRVEEGDISGLCADVMREMYGISASTKIDLITEGFEWSP